MPDQENNSSRIRAKAKTRPVVHYDFVCSDIIQGKRAPLWHRTAQVDYSQHAPPHVSSTRRMKAALYEHWKKIGCPEGVWVAHKWSTDMGNAATLFAYHNFALTANLVSFADFFGMSQFSARISLRMESSGRLDSMKHPACLLHLNNG